MRVNGYTISTGFVLSRGERYLQMAHCLAVKFSGLSLGLITEISSLCKSLDLGRFVCIFSGHLWPHPQLLVNWSVRLSSAFWSPIVLPVPTSIRRKTLAHPLPWRSLREEDNSDIASCILHTLPALAFSGPRCLGLLAAENTFQTLWVFPKKSPR